MIEYRRPSSFLYTTFNVYGYFLYSPSDPTLTAKTYGSRLFLFQGLQPGSAGAFSPFPLSFNITVLNDRNRFLNTVEGEIITNTSTLGASIVVTTKQTLFYGTDPLTGNLLWEWEVGGTMSETVPRNIITFQEYVLSPTFQYEIPSNNNAATITYS
jgi:hypothetical protein